MSQGLITRDLRPAGNGKCTEMWYAVAGATQRPSTTEPVRPDDSAKDPDEEHAPYVLLRLIVDYMIHHEYSWPDIARMVAGVPSIVADGPEEADVDTFAWWDAIGEYELKTQRLEEIRAVMERRTREFMRSCRAPDLRPESNQPKGLQDEHPGVSTARA